MSTRPPAFAVVILAGGASSRLGRDKARARVGGRTLLQRTRAAARATGRPVRVLRRDAVPRCGPLGGVLTALRRPAAERTVFLSCDQPFVTAAMIRRIAGAPGRRGLAAFYADEAGRAGFPFAVRAGALELVERLVAVGRFSLQDFARAARARRLRVTRQQAWRWFNVNTPAELAQARRLARARERGGGGRGAPGATVRSPCLRRTTARRGRNRPPARTRGPRGRGRRSRPPDR